MIVNNKHFFREVVFVDKNGFILVVSSTINYPNLSNQRERKLPDTEKLGQNLQGILTNDDNRTVVFTTV